jgi:hypothetical protein
MSIPINGVFFASLKMGYCIPENSEMGIIKFFLKKVCISIFIRGCCGYKLISYNK